MPVIGVVNLKESEFRLAALNPYLDSIRRAGGEPHLLDWTDDPAVADWYVTRCDGILFTGGDDIDPARYGQAPHEKLGSVTPERDVFELLLAEETLRQRKPIFAICRGCQLMNVALGGTLWQDIPSQRPSETPHRPETFDAESFAKLLHSVQPAAGTRFAAIAGEEPLAVNSLHHQAVDATGKDLTVSALADDGLAEAIELPESEYPFFVGVQWHPEHLAANEPRQQALFDAFVAACGK